MPAWRHRIQAERIIEMTTLILTAIFAFLVGGFIGYDERDRKG